MLTRLLSLLASFLVLFAAAGTAQAQDFPSRPVRIILPFGPGNAADVVARILAEDLSKTWGQAVTVENRAGASGILAMQELKRAPADGHTIGLGDVGTLAINPHLYNSLPYDPEKDLTIVTDLLTVPWVFFVPKDGPIRSLADLVAAARSKPGTLTYGTGGKGAPNSMAIGLLKRRLNIDMLEVPHRSSVDIYTGVSTGRLDLMAASLTTVDAYKDRLLPIAFASDDRELAGSIPALSTASGIKGFEIAAWALLVARKETPPRIVEKMRADIAAVFRKPAVRERVAKLGMAPGGTQDIAGLEKMIKSDAARYGEVVSAEKLQKQ